VDYNTISQRFFRPERPRLLEALECVLNRAPNPALLGKELMSLKHKDASFGSGRAAWASLASRDLIPISWVDDPKRLFHQGSHKDLRSHPSPLLSVLLASDVQGVVTVENLAREALARGRLWGRAVPSRVLWRMSRALPHFDHDHLGEMPLGEDLSEWSQGRRRQFPVPLIQRNTENVPLSEEVEAYFKREVLPHASDAWIDHEKTKVGYEIPFNRHFYVFEPPRSLSDIDTELKACTDRILKMIGGLQS
jgi:hypothetical protein